MLATANYSAAAILAQPATVEHITASHFECLREEWNDLLAESDSDCLFLTWEWLSTWWKVLAEDRQLRIVAVRSGHKLLAVAPLCLSAIRPLSGRILPEAMFLGSGFAGSDYLDIVARVGHKEEALAALATALADKRWSFRWSNLRRGDCVSEKAASYLCGHGWRAVETAISVCPYISLTGQTWESYLTGLGSEHRYAFNRKWKRLNREYAVQFDQAQTPAECRDAVALTIALHNARWRQRGGSDAFHTAELVNFHREFAQVALRRNWLRLFTLRLNDTPVASLYGFFYRRKFYFYQSGFDPAYEKFSVGLVTMGLAIQKAIDEGAEEYDLLHGDEGYKRHWALKSRQLSRLELYPPGFGGWMQYSTRAAGRALRRWRRG